MKKILLTTILICLLLPVVFGQQKTCNSPLNSVQFNQKYNQVANQSNEDVKLQLAKNVAQNYCMTTNQIKSFAGVFFDDMYRLDFAMTAYPNTINQQDFYDVYDAFAYFSNVFRLHDYIKSLESKPTQEEQAPIVQMPEFPQHTYPGSANYNGEKRCDNPVDQDEFKEMVLQIHSQQNDKTRATVATVVSSSHCITVSQAMKISTMIESEHARLNYLKAMHKHVYDYNNFSASVQVFQNSQYRDDLVAYITNMDATQEQQDDPPAQTKPNPVEESCTISDEDFKNMKKTIENESFNNTKVNIAKNIFRTKECFTVSQIKEVLQLFSFENSKLDLAKYAYDYCTNPDDYYQVNDVFSFSRSKNELTEYVNSKR